MRAAPGTNRTSCDEARRQGKGMLLAGESPSASGLVESAPENRSLQKSLRNPQEILKFHALAAAIILKGAKPADVPVEVNAKIEFAINLKTAKTLGLSIPPQVLFQADRVVR